MPHKAWPPRWMALVLAAAGLAGCTAASPAPAYYNPYPVPKEHPKRVHRPAPTPASAPSGRAPEGSTTGGGVAPESQLPAAAQSPVDTPPAGGPPHAATEYIEPPAR
ncbi:MAG TPA: hypothetical protein VG308_19825 [Stellaceae bacterium]|nr:hypothetical protein [Stellaceae bacterium]